MTLVLKCTCGKLLDVDEQLRGERGQCPWCGNQFIVGEVIRSTTAVQTEAMANRLVKPESPTQKCSHPGEVTADPQIACPKIIHPLVWVLMFILVLGVALTCAYFLSRPMDGDSKTDGARTMIKTLTNACDVYSLKRGRYPNKVEDLLKKDELGASYVRGADFLVDPWGRPYQYDPAGPRNNGLAPDIWTVAPDGTEIGNWPKGR